MISLKPREQYMILRKLGDHTDATTYYVRAVVRNSVTGVTLETFNMTDSGSSSRRFYKLYEIPADISGEGFWIDIETTVYTDSGYTAKASTYSEELEQYLVFDRTARTGGGGGGADVDYKKIEKILAKMIAGIEKPEKVDLAPVLLEIGHVMGLVRAIDIPEQEKLDTTPVLEAIGRAEKNVIKSIAEKEVTPGAELGAIEATLEDIKENLAEHVSHDDVRDTATNQLKRIKDTFKDIFDTPAEKQEKEEKIAVEKEDNRVKKLL